MTITHSEWEIMRIIWAHPGATMREIIQIAQSLFNWQESTIKTFIRRLIEKNFVMRNSVESPHQFTAVITESQANQERLLELFESICTTKRADAIKHLIESQPLSQSQIKLLIAQLENQIEGAPERVPCQCPPGQCNC